MAATASPKHPQISSRWFCWPNIAPLSPMPVISGSCRGPAGLGGLAALLRPNAAAEPFAGAVGLFVMMSHVGIAISLWPMIVPDHLALWWAASPLPTQAFLLVGTLFLLPVILRSTSSGRAGCSAASYASTSAVTDTHCENHS
jgi:cytochrome d ubiquinol oxidase subunit II